MPAASNGSDMPMFPLGGALLPYADLNLRIFEPRYQVMIRDVLASDGRFGVVLIERGHEVGGGDVRFDVGTVASVVRADEIGGGLWSVGAVGVERLRVRRWLPDDPYPRAEVDIVDDPPADEASLSAAAARVEAAVDSLFGLVERIEPTVERPQPSSDPLRSGYEAAAVAPLGPLDRQRILEVDDPAERLDLIAAMTAEAVELLRMRLGRDG